MFNALKKYVGKVFSGRAVSLRPITELVGSQHGWNTPLPLGDKRRVGWACVCSKTAIWDGPSVLFKPFIKAAVCKRVFQPTPMPSITPNLLRAGGEPRQAWEVHSHAGSHRRVMALVTENRFSSHKSNLLHLPLPGFGRCLIHALVPQANPHKGLLPGGGPSIAWHEHRGIPWQHAKPVTFTCSSWTGACTKLERVE